MRTTDLKDPGFKQMDAASYDVAAAEFDRLTERFSGPLADRMIDFAQLQAKKRVLDVGTGTGLVALRAGSLAKTGRIIGIDHSPGMLDLASAKAERSRLHDKVTFQHMDAEQLNFPDQSFDAVLSLYALFHFPIGSHQRDASRIADRRQSRYWRRLRPKPVFPGRPYAGRNACVAVFFRGTRPTADRTALPPAAHG